VSGVLGCKKTKFSNVAFNKTVTVSRSANGNTDNFFNLDLGKEFPAIEGMSTRKIGNVNYAWRDLKTEIKSESNPSWQLVRDESGFECVNGTRRLDHAGWGKPTLWIRISLSNQCSGANTDAQFEMSNWEGFASMAAGIEDCASTISHGRHLEEHLASLYVWDGHLPDDAFAEAAVKLSSSILCPLGAYLSNPSCVDDEDWTDIVHGSAKFTAWEGYDCDMRREGYSQPATVKLFCPKTCGVCTFNVNKQTSPFTEDACTACPPGKYSHNPGATSERDCVACPAGTYLETAGNDEERDCIECGPGKYSTAHGAMNASMCLDCGAGKYSTAVGATAIDACEARASTRRR